MNQGSHRRAPGPCSRRAGLTGGPGEGGGRGQALTPFGAAVISRQESRGWGVGEGWRVALFSHSVFLECNNLVGNASLCNQ